MFDESRIYSLNVEKRSLIRTLLRESLEHHAAGGTFEAFLKLWMSFNGYGATATLSDRDSDLVSAFGESRQWNEAFDAALSEDQDFRESVDRFRALWPIYSESACYRAYEREHRQNPDFRWPAAEELIAFARAGNGVRQAPSATNASSWHQVLEAIYMVRCNLMH